MLSPHRRLGVLGWPVTHSLSPAIQNAALEAAGLGDWRYQLLPVPPALFAATVRALPAVSFRGANVTIPHKQAALELADEASASARAIGAANTLLFESGRIRAENTDAPALLDALPLSPAGRTALVLGAGGSARAAVWALIDSGAREVQVWNRTFERAAALCRDLGGTPVRDPAPAQLLVNCTPAGMQTVGWPVKSLLRLADDLSVFECVVDFAYNRAQTPLAGAARRAGVPVVDGLDLLVGQGALCFEKFTGRAAPVDVMRAAVRAK